ncbi:MAG TPA: aspartate aminotransferase family protein, partial [Thermomicrobiales bacterium]|nr:aspartate aminotransferase family protein [Thermomicrobiales bacterium]
MRATISPDSTDVIHRDLNRTYPVVARGEGIYLFDTTGKRYLDGSGGSAAVTAIGHGVPEVAAAMSAQALTLACSPTHAFSNEPIEAAAQLILEQFAPAGMARIFFCSSGSEANENALKMAIQYHRERGEPTRQIVISRWHSFHGLTIATLALSGHTGRRRKLVPILPQSVHIAPCNFYRYGAELDPEAYGRQAADALEQEIRNLGPENVAAFIAEPVVGATLGAVPAVAGYFDRIREICSAHGVLFIADEVMTGFGRTGRSFGIDHWGVQPDLISCAKGISGGYAPLGAVMASQEIVDTVRSRSGSFLIGGTASGNPLSCAVASAVLGYVRDHDLIANAAAVGAYFQTCLEEIKATHPIVGDVRGMGLLRGVELVADRQTAAEARRMLAFD